jgi:hypothetical protein
MVHIMQGLNESEHRHGIEYQKGLDQNQTKTMNNEKEKVVMNATLWSIFFC